jgi:phosphoenolpyruvate carboxylase
MYNQKDLTDTELAELLPHSMGTQHPDNVSPVPFGNSPMVSRDLEEEEVLYNISVLGVKELMIDYERKHGACTPLWDWLHECSTCLQEKVIGRDFHVTPRIPNGDKERDDPYFWQSMGIFINSLLVMNRMGYEGLAFSEFIVPDITDGTVIAKIERDLIDRHDLQRKQYQHYGEGASFPFEGDFFIQGIPLIENVEDLLNPEPIWDELIARRLELSKRETYVQRNFIARSDPALKAGMIPAILAATVALEKGWKYEKRTGVRMPQIIGIGSAPFRGGLTPQQQSIEAVMKTYPAGTTVTIQSAFRYDYSREEVIEANEVLEERLKQAWLARDQLISNLDIEELNELKVIVKLFKERYETSYREILPLITRIAQRVPSHRERYKSVEVSGEDRSVAGLPAVRAIKFASSCYTLGISPGLLGLRAWESLREDQKLLVQKTNPWINFWLAQEYQWFNPENLTRLEQSFGLRNVVEDLQTAEGLIEEPKFHSRHAEITGQILLPLERGDDFTSLLLEAAAERRFLG